MAVMTYREHVDEMNALRAAVKDKCVIFNVVMKEITAEWHGLPLDSFYDLSFTHWIDVERHYYKACAKVAS